MEQSLTLLHAQRDIALPKPWQTFPDIEIIYNFKKNKLRKRHKIPNPTPNEHWKEHIVRRDRNCK